MEASVSNLLGGVFVVVVVISRRINTIRVILVQRTLVDPHFRGALAQRVISSDQAVAIFLMAAGVILSLLHMWKRGELMRSE